MDIAERNINSYYRAVLDALPFSVFIVDDEVRIQDFNRMAVRTFYGRRPIITNERGGDALKCIHSGDSPDGCGKGPFCSSCIIRNSVEKSFGGKVAVHKQGRFTLMMDGKQKDLKITVTANPIDIEGKKLAVLIIEGIEEK